MEDKGKRDLGFFSCHLDWDTDSSSGRSQWRWQEFGFTKGIILFLVSLWVGMEGRIQLFSRLWGYPIAEYSKSLCIQLIFFYPFRMVSQVKEGLDVGDLCPFSLFSTE
jgi:hypothetical protein